jgi:hypothetical protein
MKTPPRDAADDGYGRGPGEELRLPDGSIDTGMPITSRRAGPTQGDGEATLERAKEAPGATVLDW